MQIRDIDDGVYSALARHAADSGITVPELLRREITRIAARPSLEEWLKRTASRPSDIDKATVIEALDDVRGNWPHARP